MSTTKKKMSLTSRVILGMLLGILTGFLIRTFFADVTFIHEYIVDGLFDVGGKIFIASLKMLVVPLVFVSLVCGTSSLKDIATLGRLGGKTVAFYLATTAIAITLALFLANLFKPGAGADLSAATTFVAKEAPTLGSVIVGMFPTNPISSMANGNTLQIIVFAVLFGIAISAAGKPGERIAEIFKDLNEVIMKLVALLMNIAPFGVFFLMAKLFTGLGLDAIFNLINYFLVLVAALLIHGLVTYSAMLKIFTGLSPITFLKKMEDAVMFAFSTASSNATIPVTMETATKRLGVNNKIASFTVPLGATINMDGTAIMQGVATVFIAQAFNIDLSMGDYVAVIVTATLASVGTAGVPGVGLIMLAMVLNQVGLPVEGIAIIMGVDRLLDMIRTAVNITGDSVVSCIVAKTENELDIERFNDPQAAVEDEKVNFHPLKQES
ncbi:dicarboxylate/amino acid:cation symporter [Photobacterium leiognathi]|uniref:Dicarboxylate/amino acid:cation symporter n=1 Tax=Photobacterium leiognathi subsp. mandapamensis TaxID=48408 RepID=A0A2T3KYS4_PHOLD|nr:dicarboxylate/amino acid:cation symporter [Photobacterium leiognathi]MCG3886684.1 dicarboxylate/amino acid:cation symporter [Photobacterium leiognathi]PSV02681.1 dicarboxylate/amino acid:cation symporter [Photobacterium leiognathi subsp. mandapamensis]PSV12944.1 dicarboxylate/amino acid:cation symporter [Photobacterium leiognathi subsp. mandapamensis]PSW45012.1 dicarboxylate/amino acid:cation symporter [Photobacterium leiognathi subsp. mandapamensis]PSW56737.1 dicarboxylate/amino acid:catio